MKRVVVGFLAGIGIMGLVMCTETPKEDSFYPVETKMEYTTEQIMVDGDLKYLASLGWNEESNRTNVFRVQGNDELVFCFEKDGVETPLYTVSRKNLQAFLNRTDKLGM